MIYFKKVSVDHLKTRTVPKAPIDPILIAFRFESSYKIDGAGGMLFLGPSISFRLL